MRRVALMRRVVLIGVTCALLATGCGLVGSTDDAANDTTSTPAFTSTTMPASSASPTSATTTTSTAATTAATTSTTNTAAPDPTPPAVPAPDPLAGRTLAEICIDEGLPLIAFAYGTLQEDFAGNCCVDGGLDPEDLECSLDWPFSDVPDCAAYDRMRNAIYARYGFPFQSATYREAFGGEPWYELRQDFDDSWLTANAQANVALLLQFKEDQVGCT